MFKSLGGTSMTRVHLFGSQLLSIDGRVVCLRLNGVTLDLLRYLLLFAGKKIRRELLADRFWRRSSRKRQRSALNSALWRIRTQLKQVPGIELTTEGDIIELEISTEVGVDTVELTEAAALATERTVPREVSERLAAALEASEEPLFGGAVNDWALAERERLFHLRIRGLGLLMRWRADRKLYEDALEIGRRLLAADPLRETAQCEVMWLYVLNGQRAQALTQYRDYVKLLRRELDIEPMPETRALYDHIRSDLDCGARLRNPPRAHAAPRSPQSGALDLMLGAIEQSRLELYRTLRGFQH